MNLTKNPNIPNALDTRLITRAFDFAARAHVDQRRKGEVGEPYVNHLAEVAALLAEAAQDDFGLIAAGLLHDTVEDTAVTSADLESVFGADVATLVAEVTDDQALPKQERKRRQVTSSPGRSDRAKMLKLADKASNLRALVVTPPDWDLERRREYVAWAAEVIAGCRGVDGFLEEAFDAAHAAAVEALAAEADA